MLSDSTKPFQHTSEDVTPSVQVCQGIGKAQGIKFCLVLWESIAVRFDIMNTAEQFTSLNHIDHHVHKLFVLEAGHKIDDKRMENLAHDIALLDDRLHLALRHEIVFCL